mgnify:CR=1 FL=1
MTAPDLAAAATVIDLASRVVDAAVARLAAAGSLDDHQVLAYDVAHAASAVATAKGLLDYGAKGDVEGRITCAFVADAVGDLAGKIFGQEATWGVEPGALDGTREFLGTYRAAEFLAGITDPGPRHLDSDFEMVQDTFRRFADQKLAPIAEHIHRENGDIPEEIKVDLSHMGDTLTVRDLKLPGGIESADAPETVVCRIEVIKEVETAAEATATEGKTEPEVLTAKKEEPAAEADEKK